jgi:hypothetical protein
LQQQTKASGQIAEHRLTDGSSQAAHVPWCCDYVNVGQADLSILEQLVERQHGKFGGVLLAVEPFLFNHQEGQAVFH